MIKRCAILLFLIAFLVPPLACNYPGYVGSGETDIPVSELKKTLDALISPTPAVPSEGTAEISMPENTPVAPTQVPIFQPTVDPNSTPVSSGDAYTVMPGDTLAALTLRFDVDPSQIPLPQGLSPDGLLSAGMVLNIPSSIQGTFSSDLAIPDAEVVYSPTAADFDVDEYIMSAGGFLASYSEEHEEETLSGAQIVERIARQASVNPRLLLAFLEYRSGWVRGQPSDQEHIRFPIGFYVPGRSGLYEELSMSATQLNLGYYGWRQGNRIHIKFADGQTVRLHPYINPGSAALENLFSKFYPPETLYSSLFDAGGFLELYSQMFGDPWVRAEQSGPLIPDGLAQPYLELPFVPGERWSLTAGPHQSWDYGTPRAALDFSPTTGGAPCAISTAWATASAPGVVVRSDHNTVALDLDGDGLEQTGWVLVYYHLADEGRIQSGVPVGLDNPLGHPSCEGGKATGKHVHLSRKYNGEWIAADGPVPFVLSGWRAMADERNYQGTLIKDNQVVSSNPGGPSTSIIERQ